VYVHAHNAEAVYADFAAEYAAAGRAGRPPVWVADGRGFSPDKKPTDVGHDFAAVWQGVPTAWSSTAACACPST
jgi:hypothetical protein